MEALAAVRAIYGVINCIHRNSQKMKSNMEDAMEISDYLQAYLLPEMRYLENNRTALENPEVQDAVNRLYNTIEEAQHFFESLDVAVKGKKKSETGPFASASTGFLSQSAYANRNQKKIYKINFKLMQKSDILRWILYRVSEHEDSPGDFAKRHEEVTSYSFFPCEDTSLISSTRCCETRKIKMAGQIYLLQMIDVDDCAAQGLTLNNITDEIKILEEMSHDTISRTINHVVEEGVVCHSLHVFLEDVEGRKLSQIIGREPFIFDPKARRTTPPHGRLRIWLRQVCDALRYMHESGCCHGDLRPENIVMDIETENIKITGICIISNAHLRKSKLSESGICVRDQRRRRSGRRNSISCSYWSPERLNTGMHDSKDDMWAVGCTFAELIQGSRFTFAPADVDKLDLFDDLIERSPAMGPVVQQLLCDERVTRLTAEDVLCLPWLHDQENDFVFRIGDGPQVYSTIRLEPGEQAPEDLDCIYVLSVPLKGYEALSLPSNFTHSVVIALNRESGTGFLMEYNNTSTIQLSPCRLAIRNPASIKDDAIVLKGFRNFKGFYGCRLDIDNLTRFKKLFEEYSQYSPVKHNCHSFHRSLVATAMTDESAYNVLYSYRQADSSIKNVLFSSSKWVVLQDGSKHTDTVPDQKLLKYSLHCDFLRDENLVGVRSIALKTYDLRKHTIVCDHNMTLSVENVVESIKSERALSSSLREAEQEIDLAIENRHISQLEKALQNTFCLGKNFCPQKVQMAKELMGELRRIKTEVQQNIERSDINELCATFDKAENVRYMLSPGDTVLIHSLYHKRDLNHCTGVVEAQHRRCNGRIKVRVRGQRGNFMSEDISSANLLYVPNESIDINDGVEFDTIIVTAKLLLSNAKASFLIDAQKQLDSALESCNLSQLEMALQKVYRFRDTAEPAGKLSLAKALISDLHRVKNEVQRAIESAEAVGTLDAVINALCRRENAGYVLRCGDLVMLQGLGTKAHLNGCIGTVESYIEDEDRFKISGLRDVKPQKVSSSKLIFVSKCKTRSRNRLDFDPVITQAKNMISSRQDK